MSDAFDAPAHPLLRLLRHRTHSTNRLRKRHPPLGPKDAFDQAQLRQLRPQRSSPAGRPMDSRTRITSMRRLPKRIRLKARRRHSRHVRRMPNTSVGKGAEEAGGCVGCFKEACHTPNAILPRRGYGTLRGKYGLAQSSQGEHPSFPCIRTSPFSR